VEITKTRFARVLSGRDDVVRMAVFKMLRA